MGYGDVVPQQTAGKAIAVILMLGGLFFLAVLTGGITSVFVTRAQAETQEAGEEPALNRLGELGTRLQAVRADLSRLDEGHE